jgi:hypothetical protein
MTAANSPQAVPRLAWSQVCARRLERHALSAPAQDARPADVARAICGVHAQILTAAEWSLGLRIAGITRSQVQDALWRDHSLVKTYGPRGTVHLLAAADLPMWTGALSALPPSPSGFPDAVRLTAAQTEEIVAAIADALMEVELTADELTEALVARVGSWAGQLIAGGFQSMWPRWRQAIVVAAHHGALCFAPNKGRKVTYTNPRRWLPAFQPADGADALAAVVKHYLFAYGPATPRHFARWLAAPPGWTASLFASLAADLQQVEVAGAPAWQISVDPVPASAPAGVRLLPYFDAYAVGCHPRELVFPGVAATRALAGGQAGNFPILLIDGVVAGIWHMRRAGKKLDFTVDPFSSLTRSQRRELDEQVERIGAFFLGNPRLAIGPVTIGAHA